jgi:mannose-1-phosphate guanylyltransferase/mannose-6-phosphate isomerase
MCGGAGTRLWPASRPHRPKPFIPLVGPVSIFDRTLERLSHLADVAPPIIVAGAGHSRLIEESLAAAGLDGLVVIEPEARDSGPAMAAAALIVAGRDPEGLCIFLAADHHIPEPTAFARVVALAADHARHGGIVTLGVTPDQPSSAYGYIRPGRSGTGGMRTVEAFVEKPVTERAMELIAEGCLWNSGMFIARAQVLIDELAAHAPEMLGAASLAVDEARLDGIRLLLSDAFRSAPKTSIDYAVMEKTTQALVASADFAWSDLGAWDAVLAAAPGDDLGNHVSGSVYLEGAEGCLVNVGQGMTVAVVGGQNLAVIADQGDVMICDMGQLDRVKAMVDRIHLDRKADPMALSSATVEHYDRWLNVSALPLWWSLGADHRQGGFHEALSLEGAPVLANRRLRVQARQTHVYAQAGMAGWTGPWSQAVLHGLSALEGQFRRPDGLFRTLTTASGAAVDETAMLYDQAFVLLALATSTQAGIRPEANRAMATQLLAAIRATYAAPAGGFREAAGHSHQSNPLMHLFEASLAWIEADGSDVWRHLASEVATLANRHFVDQQGGFLREFFEPDWSPAKGEAGRVVEPGHQFEWAWLMLRWGALAGESWPRETAWRLYQCGARGIDSRRGVAMDELDPDLRVSRPSARLWPQTEWLKAAALLAEQWPEHREALLADVGRAAHGLGLYLANPVVGVYRDKLDIAGLFKDEPAPASSLYHIAGAVEALRRLQRLGLVSGA